MRTTRRSFLASLAAGLAALAALFGPRLPAAQAQAQRKTPRRRPGNKTRWIGHY